MKYVAKKADDTVNIPKASMLVEACKLVVGFVVFIGVAYLVLGLIITLIIPFLPTSVDKRLGALLIPAVTDQYECFSEGDQNSNLLKIEEMVQEYAELIPQYDYDWTVYVIDDEMVNAGAIAGGHMVFFNGLFDHLETDEELAAIVAHEMGHVVHRDHMSRFGRLMAFLLISTAILGDDNSATKLATEALVGMDYAYSRGQERKADLFAVDLMMKRYGDANAAVSIMEKFIEISGDRKGLQYFHSTHPNSSERVEYLKDHIKTHY